MSDYRENHYVAQWYERRFLPSIGEKKFYYLDLKPDQFRDEKGALRQKNGAEALGDQHLFQTDRSIHHSFRSVAVYRN
jgi:hypothetical protein